MAVALYARVSTTRQAEQDLSIPDQLRHMREWCASQNLLVAKEYVEPGASATDDRRPVFQEMIGDATIDPAPFDAIIVHSLSRFFRDVIMFGVYERRLAKLGVKVISITQQTTDDASGMLARRIFSAFDEYQSQENSKHTSRAMRENARRGYFNGARAPFGYRAVESEAIGNRGRRKKKLAVDESEAVVVQSIFGLYLDGHEGRRMGIKEIAKHLNERGQLMRGRVWGIQKVHRILSAPVYRGEFAYNVIDSKTGKKRPPSEWIGVPVEPIIDAETFERVRQRREGRRPSAVPPRRVSSPVLLTGILQCGHCGAAMTLATGKSGRYRYYKCSRRMNKGNAQCPSRNVPLPLLDELVLSQLEDKVFTPTRLQEILTEARRLLRDRTAADRQKLVRLKLELRRSDERLQRLYEAVETGALPLDDTLQRRVQQAKAARETVLVEMAGLRRRQLLPVERILPSHVVAFSKVVRRKLRDRTSAFARDYLHAIVDQVVVHDSVATITGSHERLMRAVSGKKAATDQVPSFMQGWRARRDSNSRPRGS
jgi:site-specific DNA recombinase